MTDAFRRILKFRLRVYLKCWNSNIIILECLKDVFEAEISCERFHCPIHCYALMIESHYEVAAAAGGRFRIARVLSMLLLTFRIQT
jgi:hypothetical protein